MRFILVTFSDVRRDFWLSPLSRGVCVLVPLSGDSPEYFPPPRMNWFKLSVRPRLRNLAAFPWAWILIIGVPPVV